MRLNEVNIPCDMYRLYIFFIMARYNIDLKTEISVLPSAYSIGQNLFHHANSITITLFTIELTRFFLCRHTVISRHSSFACSSVHVNVSCMASTRITFNLSGSFL